MLGKDFVGSECYINWPSINLLVLSFESHIPFSGHFFFFFVPGLLTKVLQGKLSCFSEMFSSVGPTFNFCSAKSVTICWSVFRFPLMYWHLFSVVACPLSCRFMLLFSLNLFGVISVEFQEGKDTDTWAQPTRFKQNARMWFKSRPVYFQSLYSFHNTIH